MAAATGMVLATTGAGSVASIGELSNADTAGARTGAGSTMAGAAIGAATGAAHDRIARENDYRFGNGRILGERRDGGEHGRRGNREGGAADKKGTCHHSHTTVEKFGAFPPSNGLEHVTF